MFSLLITIWAAFSIARKSRETMKIPCDAPDSNVALNRFPDPGGWDRWSVERMAMPSLMPRFFS